MKTVVTRSGYSFRADSLKILLSYHYFAKRELRGLFTDYFKTSRPRVFIDSGAFSAYTQGLEIPLDRYTDYLKVNRDLIDVAANLDDIKDPERSWNNQADLEEAGVDALPVFHVGEDFRWLEAYIEAGHEYIGLGGMVPYSNRKPELIAWISKCFKIAEAAPRKVGFHGFGMTNWDLMRAYPWKSVDSSSWTASFRFGQVYLFDEKFGRFQQANLWDLKGSYRFAEIIRGYGFSPNDLLVDDDQRRFKVAAISAAAFLSAEKWLRSKEKLSIEVYLAPPNQWGIPAADPEIFGLFWATQFIERGERGPVMTYRRASEGPALQG